ncbi:MAG: hypothetical protein IAE80_19230 [Anaerolinea sp.]|nr:hypothetical protein [Anaerolinea sp.]
MKQSTIRYALITAVIALILSLSGIFASFAPRQVIEGRLTLDVVTLVVMLGAAGYVTGGAARKEGNGGILINAVAGSLIVGVILAIFVVIEANVDLTFVFPNLRQPARATLAFGQDIFPGVVVLILLSLVIGVTAALLLIAPARWRSAILYSFALTVVIGLLESQIQNIITLPDALAVAAAFAAGYAVSVLFRLRLIPRLIASAVPGAVIGVILGVLINGGALGADGVLRGAGSMPLILSTSGGLIALVVIFAIVSLVGGLARGTSPTFHNGIVQFVGSLIVIGVLNWQNAMTDLATLLTVVLLFLMAWFVPPLGEGARVEFSGLDRPGQQLRSRLSFFVLLGLLIVVPAFVGQYITNVFNLVGLYIIMGIGLNIVVGYAGLLDLGYVAFFAIGAYSLGLLTTPSLLTCGGIDPATITPDTVGTLCTGLLTFWEAWPLSILISATAGIMLGIPVLRLRGDYLAIVTLGFGEIIRILVKFDDFKPLFGAAQGIANIPRPVIDLSAFNPDWVIALTTEASIYYLVLGGILVTALIASRLAETRMGRSWRAMRADEDVAQAMGINLTRTKLAAFAIGAAFAGMGGAVAGTRLYGAYPDSFTILVSINVLSLIIIGGLGSIPGVIVGALVLVGLPEVLRELSDYRLLAFGALLVVMMLIKPQGLIQFRPRAYAAAAEDRA